MQLPRKLPRPPKIRKRGAPRSSSDSPPHAPDEGGRRPQEARPARAGYAVLGLLLGAVFLVPLGLPFDVEGGEVLLVLGAALAGAYGPDVAAPEGPGAFVRSLFALLGLGRKGDFLTVSSRLGAGGVRATHSARAAATFAVGCAGLFAIGPAGGSAWAAASCSYAAHLWWDSKSGPHAPGDKPDPGTAGRDPDPEGERDEDRPGGRPPALAPRARGTRSGPKNRAAGLFRRLKAKLPGPPAKKRRRGKKNGTRGRTGERGKR